MGNYIDDFINALLDHNNAKYHETLGPKDISAELFLVSNGTESRVEYTVLGRDAGGLLDPNRRVQRTLVLHK